MPRSKKDSIPADSSSVTIDNKSAKASKSSKLSNTKPATKASATKPTPKAKEKLPKPNTITRMELAQEVAKAIGRMMEITARDAETIVAEIIQSIIDALRSGDEIEIRGFGAFRLRSRRPRNGRNPKTGAAVSVPGKTVCYFKQGKDLKEFLKQ